MILTKIITDYGLLKFFKLVNSLNVMNSFECHFIFIDVVRLSNPALVTEKQVEKIVILNNMIKECNS